jgi:hypothetical protein
MANGPGSPPPDSIHNLSGRVFNSARLEPVMGAYAAVVGSGGLARIRDDSLRLALADFASLLDNRYAERYADELYFDFLRSFTGRLEISDAVLATGANPSARTASARDAQRLLLRDPKFRDHLALRYLAERDVASVYRKLRAQAQRVLDLIRGLR